MTLYFPFVSPEVRSFTPSTVSLILRYANEPRGKGEPKGNRQFPNKTRWESDEVQLDAVELFSELLLKMRDFFINPIQLEHEGRRGKERRKRAS